MITDKQILEIASSYLRELYSGDVGDLVWQPLQEDALLNFARAIYEEGYDEGRYDGFDRGYDSAFYEHGGY